MQDTQHWTAEIYNSSLDAYMHSPGEDTTCTHSYMGVALKNRVSKQKLGRKVL